MFRLSTHGPITRVRMAKTLLGRPMHEVSAYLIGDLLIDTGPAATAERLVALARERGVSRVVLTHHHEDHTGGAAALRDELGVPVLAPAGALQILLEGARIPLYRKVVWGTPRCLRAEPLGPVLEHGDLRFRVVATPGHAFDHVCLFEEKRRWLLAGDLFVHERVKFLRRIEDLEQQLVSLQRALALGSELMLCAHAGVVEDPRGALARKIAWWQELGEQAQELASQGVTPRGITRRLLGREGFFTWASFGDFSKKNLIRELLALPPPRV